MTGRPTERILDLLWQSSPARVLDRIQAPTLLIQGEADSLFPLSEGDANARGIAARGVPVKVVWSGGGHDGGIDEGTSCGAPWPGSTTTCDDDSTPRTPVRDHCERGVSAGHPSGAGDPGAAGEPGMPLDIAGDRDPAADRSLDLGTGRG
jgi:ABC-2 type transport system ATP-binding protein